MRRRDARETLVKVEVRPEVLASLPDSMKAFLEARHPASREATSYGTMVFYSLRINEARRVTDCLDAIRWYTARGRATEFPAWCERHGYV